VEAKLYTSEWSIVTYINLQQASDNANAFGRYIESTERLCGKHNRLAGLNQTECITTMYDARKELGNLKEMRSLVSQITRTEGNAPKVKRRLFNNIAQVSHPLFGALGSEDEEFYNNKISN
jgi:hypothetical protein